MRQGLRAGILRLRNPEIRHHRDLRGRMIMFPLEKRKVTRCFCISVAGLLRTKEGISHPPLRRQDLERGARTVVLPWHL
jgi:hypothetical protein